MYLSLCFILMMKKCTFYILQFKSPLSGPSRLKSERSGGRKGSDSMWGQGHNEGRGRWWRGSKALRRLADSNVKTLSNGEMMNREREIQWLWLPLRRIGGGGFIYIRFYTFIFQLFLNQLCVKVATFFCFKSHEFLVSLKISASPGVSS